MMELDALRQLTAFAELGTQSRVAERFHISTPSVTRAMQQAGAGLRRGAVHQRKEPDRAERDRAGAVDYARRLLDEAEQAVRQVRAFDQRRRTVVVKSCAPAPLWELLPRLNARQPGGMVSSEICGSEEVRCAWEEGACDIAILPFPAAGAQPFMRKDLFVCVPPEHELARRKTLTFADINGFNFLLRTQLGFWDALCREKMPASKFLVQTDAAVFDELVRASSLPCFTTDYGQLQGGYPDRVNIPLTDTAAHITFIF